MLPSLIIVLVLRILQLLVSSSFITDSALAPSRLVCMACTNKIPVVFEKYQVKWRHGPSLTSPLSLAPAPPHLFRNCSGIGMLAWKGVPMSAYGGGQFGPAWRWGAQGCRTFPASPMDGMDTNTTMVVPKEKLERPSGLLPIRLPLLRTLEPQVGNGLLTGTRIGVSSFFLFASKPSITRTHGQDAHSIIPIRAVLDFVC